MDRPEGFDPELERLPASLRPLADLDPPRVARAVRRRDLGYACYLYFGVLLAVAGVLHSLPVDSWLNTLVADHLGATVLFGFALAGIVGVWVSAATWRDRPLLLLAIATAALAPVVWWASDAVSGAFFFAYTLLALALPARWFLSLRGRLLAAADPRD